MTQDSTLDQQLAAIASRHHAAPRREVAGPDALADLVVVPTLREAIVGNLLPPGSRLLEIPLAAKLGVSRTPVREAFAQLDEAVAAMKARVDADDPVGYTQELDAFYATVMTLADNVVLHRTHDGLLGPVRRLRRIAMSREGRMRASYEQTERIRDALVKGDLACVALMREQLAKACQAAKDALNV